MTATATATEELLQLCATTARIWRRRLPMLAFWFSLGFAVHTGCLVLSSLVGATHPVLGTLLFVLGVVAKVVALVLMIDSCFDDLGTVQRLQGTDALPESVLTSQPRLVMLTGSLGPFLAVYALWGLVEQEVSGLFFINIAVHGSGGVDEWSVNLQWVTFYLVLALVCGVLRLAVGQLSRRRRWLAGPAVALEGLWVFASFLALTAVGDRITDWIGSRAVAEWLREGWWGLLDALPDLHLPFDWTLPALVRSAGSWTWYTLLPGVWTQLLLPLVWLALTLAVFGWQRIDQVDDLLHSSGGRVGTTADRLRQRLGEGPLQRWTRRLGAVATNDLQTKYVPVLTSLRLVLATGLRFLGAYLVLAAALTTLIAGAEVVLDLLIGPRDIATGLVLVPFLDLVTGLVGTSLQVALYVAAADRVLAAAAGPTPTAGGDAVSARSGSSTPRSPVPPAG